MCLSCFDPIISALRELNPFKAKRTGKINAEKDQVDRDDIAVPFVLKEKRSIIVPDPEPGKSTNMSLKVREETVVTMKKVSSLALV